MGRKGDAALLRALAVTMLLTTCCTGELVWMEGHTELLWVSAVIALVWQVHR